MSAERSPNGGRHRPTGTVEADAKRFRSRHLPCQSTGLPSQLPSDGERRHGSPQSFSIYSGKKAHHIGQHVAMHRTKRSYGSIARSPAGRCSGGRWMADSRVCEFVGGDCLQNPGLCRVGTIGGTVSCWVGGHRTKSGTSHMAPTWMKEHLSGDVASRRSTAELVVSSAIGYASILKADRRAGPRQPTYVPTRIRKCGASCTRSRAETSFAWNSTEGVPGRNYQPTWLNANDKDGNPVLAITYVATGKEIDGNPSHRYISLLREGARFHGLPDHWLRLLDSVKHAD